ncbi:hypothetical protein [Mycobacterium phage Weirdo19]|uniref:Uncharacterized protein n=1 Tax=Mycobacterium phage Weirdo19 TaxID=2601610 RepID=A0A6M2YSV9_9CAUD|nr:hypothetical protein KDJ11_gp56 [Mycobacterium phage Weirdo19]QEA10824.1 hypothetical protein [Mycobacterium phage Weirdo19]
MNAPELPGRLFSIGQVLTLTSSNIEAQQMFCSYGDLLDVLGYLLSDVPMAEDIPAAIEQCRPAVRRAHPSLAHLTPPAPLAPDTEVLTWLSAMAAAHGEQLMLRPIIPPTGEA